MPELTVMTGHVIFGEAAKSMITLPAGSINIPGIKKINLCLRGILSIRSDNYFRSNDT